MSEPRLVDVTGRMRSPAAMPKRNSALIGNYGRLTDDASLSKLASSTSLTQSDGGHGNLP